MDVSATSTPSGMSPTPSSAMIDLISCTARACRPTRGWIAPWSPVFPPTEFVSSYRWGSCRRWALAAEPKSKIRGRPVRVSRA